MSKAVIDALVSALLLLGGPSHISGRIVSGPIWKSVEGVSWGWSRADVREERLERVPLIANCDTRSAVQPKLLVVWVEASTAHGLPSYVLGAFAHAVSRDGGGDSIVPQAPAATSQTPRQVGPNHDLLLSAFAPAKPTVPIGPFAGICKNREPVELHPEKAFEVGGRGCCGHPQSVFEALASWQSRPLDCAMSWTKPLLLKEMNDVQ